MATIRDLLANDPIDHGLANDGQARLRTEADEHAERELRAELRSFVCDGQYGEALDRIFGGYLRALNRDRQVAAWVSGFFGSGKSHLLKMAGHLWVNTEFSDGATARELVVGLPDSVTAHLRELDSAAKRLGVPLLAAMGQLPAGDAEFVRPTIASIVLSAQGLPRQIPLARFVFWLREHGLEETVRSAVEAAGKNWFKELENLAVSPIIAGAVRRAIPDFAHSDADARKLFASTYPAQKTDLSTEDFIQVIRTALEQDGQLPLTVLVLDEVQQYIADSDERAAIVTEAVEALYTRLDSRVLVIAAGQSALAQGGLLTKLRDRFVVQDALSDADVEAVTRKVVLAKKPSQEGAIRDLLERHAGEIGRHLSDSAIAQRDGDRHTRVVDYPLLPTRRRFWEACFKAVDAAGTHSQLRSQLQVIHTCVRSAASQPLGHVVPAEALYASIADRLVNTAVLIPELFQRIEKLQDGTPEGHRRYSACGLVFLISKLPREEGADLGIRATARVIADLMVSDLTVDSGPFRGSVENSLEALVEEGVLMKVDSEYRLQTREGQAWDAAFRSAEQSLRSQSSDVELARERLFHDSIAQTIGSVRVSQGSAKIRRELLPHFGIDEPSSGQKITVWVRDGWGASERDVLASARSRGTDDPVIHLFIPKKEADALRSAIVEGLAAQKVLDQKGFPSTREGEEAHQSMASRKAAADQRVKGLVQEILRDAAVYQGGGHRLPQADLGAAIEAAANAAVGRLYPRFDEADSAHWDKVIQAAKLGSDEPMSAVGHRGKVDDHPVCREVLSVIGKGQAGSAIRRSLEQPPFGWPRDAVDAALMVLHRAGIVSVTDRKDTSISPGSLDQNLIPAASFRPEQVRVTANHRLVVRGLCSHCGIAGVRSNEESAGLDKAIAALRALAAQAGGEAPRPAMPQSPLLDDLEQLQGGERLLKAAAEVKAIKDLHDEWRRQADRVAARLPAWQRAASLAKAAKGLDECSTVIAEIEAVRAGRLLLNDPDPVPRLAHDLSVALRAAVTSAHEAHVAQVTDGRRTIEGDGSWSKLDDVTRGEILAANRLELPAEPDLGTDEAILAELERQSIESRRSAASLVPGRVTAALTAAAKHLSPQSVAVRIAPITLRTPEEVEAWIDTRRRELLEAVERGPVVVG